AYAGFRRSTTEEVRFQRARTAHPMYISALSRRSPMPARPADAALFHDLHKQLLLLPNAWDAASARVVQEAGAKAIATSSAAVAWAHGFPDGHGLPPAKLATVVEEIARVVSVPVTVDSEGGYSDDPAEVEKNIASFLDAGGVGINLEDGRSPHELHLRKI